MSPKLTNFLNKVCWQKQISQLKSEDLKQYFQKLLLVKNLLIKLIAFISIGIIVMGSCFTLRQIFIDNFPEKIHPNPGISFSAMANAHPSIIYLIQILPCVMIFLFFFFLNDKATCFCLLVVFFGGVSNVVDRALPLDIIVYGGMKFPAHAVVDYIPLITTTCNLPDIYITAGACFALLFLIIYIKKIFKTENNNKSSQPSHDAEKP